MCNFLSAILLKNGDVLCNPLLDSHEDLLDYYNVHQGYIGEQGFARLEFLPPENDLGQPVEYDIENYKLKVEEDRWPEWLLQDTLHTKVVPKLKAILKKMVITPTSQEAFGKILVGGCWILAPGAQLDTVKAAFIRSMYGDSSIQRLENNSMLGIMYDNSSIGVVRDSRIWRVYGHSRITTLNMNSLVAYLGDYGHIGEVNYSVINLVSGAATISKVKNLSIVRNAYCKLIIPFVECGCTIKWTTLKQDTYNFIV